VRVGGALFFGGKKQSLSGLRDGGGLMSINRYWSVLLLCMIVNFTVCAESCDWLLLSSEKTNQEIANFEQFVADTYGLRITQIFQSEVVPIERDYQITEIIGYAFSHYRSITGISFLKEKLFKTKAKEDIVKVLEENVLKNISNR